MYITMYIVQAIVTRLYRCAVALDHRVDRVLGFFSSHQSWDPPTPSPAGEWVLPLCFWGGDTLACGRGRVGWSQLGWGDRHCVTLGIDVLCAHNYLKREWLLGDFESRVNSFGPRVTIDGYEGLLAYIRRRTDLKIFSTFFGILIRVLRLCREELRVNTK